MKAIQIKYLSPTDTKPARLKVQTWGCSPKIECINSDKELEEQARMLAQNYLNWLATDLDNGWDKIKIIGWGTILNGDYVATLGA